MITPATYSLASSGPIQGRNRCLKKSQPKNAIENGFTSQLTMIVITKPVGRRPTFRIAQKSIFSIIG